MYKKDFMQINENKKIIVMKQKLLNLRAFLLLMVLSLATAAWAEGWTRCTSVSDLTSGGTFIIGYEATANSGKIIPMKNVEGTATTSAAGYMASGNEIDMATIAETADYEFTIVASTTVDGAICIKAGDSFIGNTNTKNNLKLFAEESATTSFGVTVDANDVFALKIAANATYHTLQYNASSPRFAVYGGTQKNLVIYKKSTSGGETPVPTLSSIVVSGTPVKTSYFDGDAFDTTGLVVTGKYSDNSTAEITSGVTWAVTPKTLSVGTTSVSVVATVNGISSEAYTVNGLVVSAISDKTIADFIASEGGKCYLTGTVSNIANTTYGNFDLTDESGTIFIYGCLTPAGEAKKFAELDVVEGDKIKVLADEYKLYGEKDEAVNVVFIEEIAQEGPAKLTPTISASIPASLTVGTTVEYEVSYDGDGELSVNSSKTEVATAAISNKTLTVTPIAVGTTTITISSAETENYAAGSKSYTLKVEAPVVPAELPFSFDGGKADIETTNGMSQNGLGSDYSSSPKLKFDSTNDEVVINYNGTAKTLEYTIKGNGFSGGAFDVLESANGTDYTSLASHVDLASSNTEMNHLLKPESRYVKFIYTTKDAGNVALGAIKINNELAQPELAFEKDEYTFFVDATDASVKAVSKAGSTGAITYSSSDEGHLEVNDEGVITYMSVGEYTIKATIAETAQHKAGSATCTVKVLESADESGYVALVAEQKGKFYMAENSIEGTLKYFKTVEVNAVNGKVVNAQNISSYAWNVTIEGTAATVQNVNGDYLYVNAGNTTAGLSIDEKVLYCENGIFYDSELKTRGFAFNYNNGSTPRMASYNVDNYPAAKIFEFCDGYVRDITLAEDQEVKFGTICLDRTIEADDLAGATFYSIAGKKVNANDVVTSIVLEEETEGLIAGYPYIFAATANVVAAYTGDVEATAADSNNGLVGSLGGTDVAEGMYLITNNTVKKCGTGCKIGANRAYINMDDVPPYTATAGAKVIELAIEGETTGISNVEFDNSGIQESRIYNLAGQRVNASAKGMLIKNGKKYLVK